MTSYTEQLARLKFPPKHGSTAVVPSAPNYKESSAWAVIPFADNAPADVFYIHPTTCPVSGYHGYGVGDLAQVSADSRWNQPFDDINTQLWAQQITQEQAGVFSSDCRVYAPYYRQANILALPEIVMRDAAWGRQVLAIAYSDIERAFRHYIEDLNNDRPFFIAGHSQGSLHGLRLLKEYVSGTDLVSRLAGAYLIGIDISSDDLAAIPDIPLCKKEGEPATLVAYKCWRHDITPDVPKDNLVVNPDEWGFAGIDDSGDYHEAYIEGGALQINMLEDSDLTDWQGDTGNLHAHDYHLFRNQLQANIHDQVCNIMKCAVQ